jgi:hypothetical protein
MIETLWRITKGYRLRPWASPYLRWRMETYGGGHAEDFTAADFFRFAWRNRRALWRFLIWSSKMDPTA